RRAPFLLHLFCFLLLPPLPPGSPLFPYTTLFRSARAPPLRCRCCSPPRPHRRSGPTPATAPPSRARGFHRAPRGGNRAGAPRPTDRKSTRLNSSHVKISYAVFCLKKKKQTHIYTA